MPIGGFRTILLIGVFLTVGGLPGCGVSSSPDGASSSAETGDFLGISFSAFGDDRPFPVYTDAVTSQSTRVSFPEDLFDSVPLEAVMVLTDPSVTTVDDGGEGDSVFPAAQPAEGQVGIILRVAPHDSDACASTAQIGPFEGTVVNGVVTLASEALLLSAEAQSVVHSGQFDICAQVEGDFGGSVVVGPITLQFGRLRSDAHPVELCHVPPGDPENRHTITVGSPAVAAHLDHSDYLGVCLDSVTNLSLTSVCSDEPDVQRQWRIDNPNDFERVVTWEVAGSDQAGTATALPGESFFLTDAVEGANTTTIRWYDEIGIQRSEAEGSAGEQCVIDADGDGVQDGIDTCPGTPVAEEVDAVGCSCSQRDADGDGLNDCTDACPNTPTGETVDGVGCGCSQLDSDGDGVRDCDDQCLDTLAGAEVDVNGCPSGDTDGDGVSDGVDACPMTPQGEAVDENGCSCGELDGDDDAVNDCDDLCPDSPAGVSVDGFGCEVALVDAGPDVTLDEAGAVTLQGSASGGTPPYTYTWSAPGWKGASGQSVIVLVAQTATYTLKVTDWSFPPQTISDTVTVTVTTRDDLQYTIIDLGSLSSNSSYPSGINNLGQVVGYSFTDSFQKRAFLYREGMMIDLGTLGGSQAWAYDINDAGQVVGEAQTAGGDWHAFLWDGTNGMQDLGTLGGPNSVAYAINEVGQVVGFSSVDLVNHAFLYTDGAIGDLSTFDYNQSGAFDINDQSQIVGLLLPVSGTASAFIHQDGTLTDFGSPLLTNSEAWVINNSGLVAGHSWGAGQFQSFLYAGGEAVDLGTIEGFANTFVWGISDTGQLVGSVTDATGTLSHAFVYTGGELRDANDLLVPDHGWDSLVKSNAVNNDGQIAGYGRIDGAFSAFLLTPVP